MGSGRHEKIEDVDLTTMTMYGNDKEAISTPIPILETISSSSNRAIGRAVKQIPFASGTAVRTSIKPYFRVERTCNIGCSRRHRQPVTIHEH